MLAIPPGLVRWIFGIALAVSVLAMGCNGPDSRARGSIKAGDEAAKQRALREALNHYRTAAVAEPASLEAQMRRGAMAELLGEFDEALDAYARASRLHPSGLAYYRAGAMANRMGNTVLATEYLNASLQAPATRGERWERIFLAMCVSSGERGREYLERLSDDHLSSDVLRRARTWMLEHPDSPTVGLPSNDEQLAQAVSEIVVRASGQQTDTNALEVGYLGLERRRLEREIKHAADAEDFERQRELSLRRNETTEAIARLMGAVDVPHEQAPSGGSGAGGDA